jgi:hypothetical protein
MRISVIALTGLLVLPVAAGAQSSSASPQPAKKSDSDKKDKKVYTNDDLEAAGKDGKSGKGGAVTFLPEPQRPPDSGHAGTSSGSTNASSEESRVSGEGGSAASEESGAPGERGWRERAKEKRDAVQSALAEVQKLEAKLDALRNPQQQPQPIEALQPDPQRRLTRDQERIELEKELEGARQGFAEAQKALDDFMEEARRANVPPGWVEER